tara:strand:+ start:897 stop:1277 length:381 start_codon:yes stop_codon:yes gene_type:complete
MVKRSKVVKKLDTIFSIYIRKRYAIDDIAECFTCGVQKNIKELQCGHFQSRRYYSTRWDKLNCQVQCAKCNIFSQGEQYIFGQRLDQTYGEGTSNELMMKAKHLVKLSTNELEEMINVYKNLVADI